MVSKTQNFGIGLWARNSFEETVNMAKVSESLGFTEVWIAEDYCFGGAFSTAAALALNTSKIKVGIGVINPYTRHPVLTAMETATLDVASSGRVILGMGMSNKLWMEDRMGIPFEKPLTALKESTTIIRELMRGETLNFNGEVYHVNNTKLDFKTYRNELPIYYGVKGPQAIDAAIQHADGLLLSNPVSITYAKLIKERIREKCAEIGRNPDEIKVSAYMVASISEDRQKAREAAKSQVGRTLGLHGLHPILKCTGMPEDEILAFRDLFVKGQDASHLVTDWHLDTFAFAGTPGEVKEKLAALVEAGVDCPVAFQVQGVSMAETMEQFGKYIL